MSRLCREWFIFRWKWNALWELVNKSNKTQKIRHPWFRGVRNSSFAVCRIRGVPLISAFKRRFGVWIVLYPVSDKFELRDNSLRKRMAHIYNFRSTSKLRICEPYVGRTFACLEVNWMSTVGALHEHCMSTEVSELNLSVDWNTLYWWKSAAATAFLLGTPITMFFLRCFHKKFFVSLPVISN